MDVSRRQIGARRKRENRFGTARVRGWLTGFLLASGVSGAVAQSPAVSSRAAVLLPPRPLAATDAPPVARGVADGLSDTAMGSTPVVRKGGKAAPPAGPAWLTGIDPNVLPAGGGVTPASAGNAVRPLSPIPKGSQGMTGVNPAYAFKSFDKSKPATPAEEPKPTETPPPPSVPPTPPVPADANTPLRGVAANGAPVLAGPPAYRWYGYGSVTPGANTYAPTGQYPKASANWYSVTGATPGAFPVPVMNPYRASPGSEPPVYVNTPAPRPSVPPEPYVASAPAAPPLVPNRPTERPVPLHTVPPRPVIAPTLPARLPTPPPASTPAPPLVTPPVSKFAPAPILHEVEPPRLLPVPSPSQVAAKPPEVKPIPSPVPPVGVPALVAPPGVKPPTMAMPSVLPPVAVADRPTTPPASAGAKTPEAGSFVATKPAGSTPAPLPVSVTEEIKWQPTTEGTLPAPAGTWMPATGASGKPAAADPFGPAAVNTRQLIRVRAQMPDTEAPSDPATAVIQSVCRGRATNVEVRWTESKKLIVCFEIRGQPEATRLVRDISARPELAPLQIDFCVLVK